MNKSVLFTVLLPVHRSPELLLFSIDSVLSQTITSFELFIICDGAPQSTFAYAYALMEKDSRVRVFDFPKGERHGEAYRHTVLMQARGEYVAQIADDDIWFPNHLDEMKKLLQRVDFGNLTHTFIVKENEIAIFLENLSDPDVVTKMLTTKYNFFGPTVCGYRLSAYKKLDSGWAPAPEDVWTDLHMWRKFLSALDISYGSRYAITSLHFPASMRQQMSVVERQCENNAWAIKTKSAFVRDEITQKIVMKYVRQFLLMRDAETALVK